MVAAPANFVTFSREGGTYPIVADTGMGKLFRPMGYATAPGGVLATLETLYDFFIDNVPDPDNALAQNPEYYEAIRQQPDVHAAMRRRELTVAGMPWRIEPSNEPGVDKTAAQKIRDYVWDVYRDLPDIEEFWRQHQAAVLYGGRGFEFMWQNVRGHQRPVRWLSIDKSRFTMDRQGNMALLTRDLPVWGTQTGASLTAPVTPLETRSDGARLLPFIAGKFLYHRYMTEPGQWYNPANEGYQYWGRGEGTYLFLVFTFSHFVLRFRMKWLERFGIPLTVLYHPDNAQERLTQIRRIAESIRGQSVISVPFVAGRMESKHDNLYKIEQIDPPHTSYDAFAMFDENWTRPAVQKILLNAADQMQHGDKGAYSADVVQQESGPAMLYRFDALRIASTHNVQLIPYIVWYGFGFNIPLSYMPKLVIEPAEEKDVKANAENIQAAMNMGLDVPEEWARERLGIPKPKVGADGQMEPILHGQQGGDPLEALMGGFGAGGGGPKPPGMPRPQVERTTPVGLGEGRGEDSVAKEADREPRDH